MGARELVTVLGPSGSGKTTVLRIVGGFAEAATRRVRIDGTDVTGLPINRRPCHTVLQDRALFPHIGVARNVGYGLMVRGQPRAEVARRVAAVLGVVGLAGLADRRPVQLSGGWQQRAALARATVLESKLVLLDEPLAALDAELRRRMPGFLKDLLQGRLGTCFLFVAHDREEAIAMADRIVVMRQGRIEQVGSPREIHRRPRTACVAGFFGDGNLVPVEVADRGAGVAVVVDGPLGRLTVPGQVAGGRAFPALAVSCCRWSRSSRSASGRSRTTRWCRPSLANHAELFANPIYLRVLPARGSWPADDARLPPARLPGGAARLAAAGLARWAGLGPPSGWQTVRHVLRPHLATAVASAGVLAFTLSLDETLTTVFPVGDGMTLPIRLWAMMRVGFTPEVNALATLVLLATTMVTLGLGLRWRRQTGDLAAAED